MAGRKGGTETAADADAAGGGGAAGSLTEHLQLSILGEMNRKSLTRLHLVCKSWNSFISEQHLLQPLGFFYNPLRRSTAARPSDDQAELLTIFSRCLNLAPVFDEKLGFLPGPLHDFKLADCLDGILLFHQAGDAFLVCNPVTEKFSSVPYFTPPVTEKFAAAPYFAPPLADRSFASFLAFDFSAAGDRDLDRFFKIVSFLNGHIHIYSSHKGRWDVPVPLLRDPWPNSSYRKAPAHAAFCKGFLYVAGFSYVLRIGVSKGNQTIIPPPAGSELAAEEEGRNARTADRLLGILVNRVCYAELEELLLRVWVLDERAGKWDLRLKTKIHNKRLKSRPWMLGFHPYLPFVFFHTGRVVVAFDIKAKILEKVSALGTAAKIKLSETVAFPFLPSRRNFNL